MQVARGLLGAFLFTAHHFATFMVRRFAQSADETVSCHGPTAVFLSLESAATSKCPATLSPVIRPRWTHALNEYCVSLPASRTALEDFCEPFSHQCTGKTANNKWRGEAIITQQERCPVWHQTENAVAGLALKSEFGTAQVRRKTLHGAHGDRDEALCFPCETGATDHRRRAAAAHCQTSTRTNIEEALTEQ